jgi:hypothetical protein
MDCHAEVSRTEAWPLFEITHQMPAGSSACGWPGNENIQTRNPDNKED